MDLGQKIYTHEKYTEQAQHWSADSEAYAAASQLLSALRDGWMLALPQVCARQIWNSGSRPRTVYDFTLARAGQLMIMPVLSNPFVERFILQEGIQAIHDAPERAALAQ